MGLLQVAVADCDPAVHRSLQAAMQRDAQLQFVGGARDGVEAYQLIRQKQPDVVVIDLVMPKIDGFTLIEQVKKDRSIRKEPQFILTTSAHNEQIMAAAFRMGVSYFLLKPYDAQTLTNRVKQLTGMETGFDYTKTVPVEESVRIPAQPEVESIIKDMLHQLGIPAHLRGYRYMVTAIRAALEDDEMLECVTKLLYPYVAKEHGSTASRVERALRHAIEVAWGRGSIEAQDRLFGHTVSTRRGKPTNSEFIAMVSSCIQCR
ncbi:MAG: sporulation transcription factor Spo0A [Lachnospiraceae bacterium]|nr:sporulation transcription factor Spo0A [Lachnospiraceae bacterium]